MKYCSLDIESCNGRSFGASMCSFGYALADADLTLTEQKDILINPLPKKFMLGRPGETSKITLAYTEEEFRSAPKFVGRYREIRSKIEGRTVIGFSLGNDLMYLNNACDVFHLPRIPFRFLDVQTIYMIAKNVPQKGLGALAEEYGISFIPHRSDEDARVTLEVLKRLADEYGGIENLLKTFGIVLGENRADGYSDCYSREVYVGNVGQRSRKMRVALFTEFLKKQKRADGGALVGKRVCLDDPIEYEDVNYSRRIVAATYAQGGKYASAESCNLFIARGQSKRLAYVKAVNRRAKIITEQDFLQMIGGTLPQIEVNDESLLAKEFAWHPRVSEEELRARRAEKDRARSRALTAAASTTHA